MGVKKSNFMFHQASLGFKIYYGMQGWSGSAWIRIVLGNWIRIRFGGKSWIQIRIKGKVQKPWRFKGPWRVVYAHNRCVETQNGALEGL